MTPKKYDIDFVRNTIKVLTSNYEHIERQDLEVTFLINCLMGLIITTYEKIEKTKNTIFNRPLSDPEIILKVPPKKSYIKIAEALTKFKENINEIDFINAKKEHEINGVNIEILDCSDMRLIEFLNKIRNAIAHQHVDPIDNRGKWHAIKIWNISDLGIKNFEAEFTTHELKEFALFIAEEYCQI